MNHLIIGTAGHVDHGKTSLVKAMTGIDTDRLKEEKERGISIELGFASLVLPGGKKASIVDVPGHERFIKNMLAGAGGFDLVLLVIAADEGVMPQTREHLDIIELLQVNKGIVVITKIDLVEEDWLELVREEVKEFTEGTFLENAPMVSVSAVTGQGISELLEQIDQLARKAQAKKIAGLPRLPVDRVFSITGFGTVVTGTLLSGSLQVGDVVEVQPQGLSSRVRSLQVHGEKQERAAAGQRVAVNLAGLEVEQIERGSVVAGLKSIEPSHRLDVRLLLLKSAGRPLKNRARVRFYLGTRETLGRIVLLDHEELEPGNLAYAQVELEEQAVAVRGDRFVIRSYSPMRTIGGGSIIDPQPKGKHKRLRKEVLDALATRERGTPVELVEQYLLGVKGLSGPGDIAKGTGLQQLEVDESIRELAGKEIVKQIPGDGRVYLASMSNYRRWYGDIQSLLHAYHRDYPLREGYPKEELRSRRFPVLNNKSFQYLLSEMEKDGLLRSTPQSVAMTDFNPGPDPVLGKVINEIMKELADSSFTPPTWDELIQGKYINDTVALEILLYLLRTGEIVKITDELLFHRDVLAEAKEKVSDYLKEKGEISVGETRDILNTSRKYALPLLEYFDREKITRRAGDKRLPGRGI